MSDFLSFEVDESSKLNTQFSKWYPLFSHVTMKSIMLELPDSFIEYLREDDDDDDVLHTLLLINWHCICGELDRTANQGIAID